MSKPCKLLALPAELKNEIYRYALLTPGDIKIRTAGDIPSEPGLLRTCREIRSDAINIYYQENIFHFNIRNYNADLYMQWFRTPSRHRYQPQHAFQIRAPSAGSWPNLMRWLEAIFKKEAFGTLPPEDNDTAQTKAVAHLCDIVYRMRDGGKGATWEDVVAILENVRGTLVASGVTWI